MKHVFGVGSVLALMFCVPVAAFAQTTLLSDAFSSATLNSQLWKIPTWVSSTDGTFVGRTQFRVTQNSPLPAIQNGNVLITLDSYNPTGFSFYGTDLISTQSFSVAPNQGLHVTVRARVNTPVSPGTVAGIFLYALKPGSTTLHDEIDFELLGSRPTQVQTNIYGNEPLGAGTPQFITLANGGTIGGYHTYEIKWFNDKVEWYIDGTRVRTATSKIPTGPMYLHLNMWAPDTSWAEAYNASIQPVNSASSNTRWSMNVDSVTVQSVSNTPSPTASFTSIPSCIIPNGGTQCPVSVSWTSANPSAGTVGLYSCTARYASEFMAITGEGAQTHGPVYLTPARKCLQIRDTKTNLSLTQATLNITCATGTKWYPSFTVKGAGVCLP